MTEHNPEDNTPSLSSLSPSSSPPPSLFVFSVAQEPGDVRGLLSGVAKVKQPEYSQPPHIALLWEQNSTFQLLSWTILRHDDIWKIRCSQIRESPWPSVTTEQPRPGSSPWPWSRYGEMTINPPGPGWPVLYTPYRHLMSAVPCQTRDHGGFLLPF